MIVLDWSPAKLNNLALYLSQMNRRRIKDSWPSCNTFSCFSWVVWNKTVRRWLIIRVLYLIKKDSTLDGGSYGWLFHIEFFLYRGLRNLAFLCYLWICWDLRRLSFKIIQAVLILNNRGRLERYIGIIRMLKSYWSVIDIWKTLLHHHLDIGIQLFYSTFLKLLYHIIVCAIFIMSWCYSTADWIRPESHVYCRVQHLLMSVWFYIRITIKYNTSVDLVIIILPLKIHPLPRAVPVNRFPSIKHSPLWLHFSLIFVVSAQYRSAWLPVFEGVSLHLYYILKI